MNLWRLLWQSTVSLNDLRFFDPETLSWTDLSVFAQGDVPSQRYSSNLIASRGQLYTFGGRSGAGEECESSLPEERVDAIRNQASS